MFYNPRLKPKGHAGVPTVFPMEKLLGPSDYELDYAALICYSILPCWTVKDQLG